MRGFRDRDFLKTKENFFFCVIGPLHPKHRVLAYLKYVPANSGLWGRKGRRFRRMIRTYTMENLLETFKFLQRNHPQFLFYSPFWRITLTAVPQEYILVHFKPEKKLAELNQASHLDLLQKIMLQFTSFLTKSTNVSLNDLGVTGSLLLNIHQPSFSDIDLTVYGLRNTLAVKETLIQISSSSTSPITRLSGSSLRDWCKRQSQRYPLTPTEALAIYQRKWNLGFFQGTPFSIHPVQLESEVTEEYGEKIHYSIGSATIRAIVHNNSDSHFLPSVYNVKEIEILEGPRVTDIKEVVSYESLYANLAHVGERIEVHGKLERVEEQKTNQKYYRLLVGSPEGKGREYLKMV